MVRQSVATALVLIAATPALAQVGRIPPNAIDRATTVDDVRRSSIDTAARADRERAERDARDTATRPGPPPQSTMTDRVSGLNGTLVPPAAPAPPPPPPTIPN